MSQEGLFLLCAPDALARACAGWAPGLSEPVVERVPTLSGGGEQTMKRYIAEHPSPPKVQFADVFARIAALQPMALEMGLGGSWRSIIEGASVAFYGFDVEDAETEEDHRWAMMCPYPVYDLEDQDADRVLESMPAWARYADSALRHAAGLRPYFFLFSY